MQSKPARNHILFIFSFFIGFCFIVNVLSVGANSLNLAGKAESAPNNVNEATKANNLYSNNSIVILESEFKITTSKNVLMIFQNFTIHIITNESAEFYIKIGANTTWKDTVYYYMPVNYTFPYVDSIEQIKVFKTNNTGNSSLIYESPLVIIIKHDHLTQSILEPEKSLISINFDELKNIKSNIFYGEITAFIISILFALVIVFWLRILKPVINLCGSVPIDRVKANNKPKTIDKAIKEPKSFIENKADNEVK